jgi:hypothetical protein
MKAVFRPMQRLLLVLPLALVGIGCDVDDLTHGHWDHECGRVVSRSYDLTGFDAIHVGDALRLEVRQADAFRVEVSVPEGAEDDLEVRQQGAWLRIGGAGRCGAERRVTVELPVLRRLEAEQASRVALRGLSSSGRLELDLSDASQIDGDLVANVTLIRLSTASEAELSGATERLELNATEVSRAKLRDLAARRADVELSAASTATVSVGEWLDVTASGLSVLRYAGDPQLGQVNLSGGSRLERER